MKSYLSSKEYVSFLEKPASKIEIAASDLLNDFFSLFNQKKLDALVSYFTLDAEIDSLSYGGIINLDDYKKLIKESFYAFSRITFNDIIITIQNNDSVCAHGFLEIIYTDGKSVSNQAVHCLALTSGGWRIKSIKYLTRKTLPGKVNRESPR